MNAKNPNSTPTKTLAARITRTAGIAVIIATSTFSISCVVPATSSVSLGSISSISGSSASSAAHHKNNHSAYYNDLRESTAAAIIAQASSDEVLRCVTRAAKQHGISDWEAEEGSFIALGEGLRLAGLDDAKAQDWVRRLSVGKTKSAHLILQGFQA